MSKTGQICRTCLSSEKELISIYTLISSSGREDQNGTRIVDCFTECFKIEMTENDKLPQKICLSCLDDILKVQKFYDKCTNSAKYLKQQISDDKILIKIEPTITIQTSYEDKGEIEDVNLEEFIEYEVLDEAIDTHSELVKNTLAFHCVECNEGFKYEKNYNFHMKFDHNKKLMESINVSNTQNFDDNKNLTESHSEIKMFSPKEERLNSVDKPYKCEICDYFFKFKSNFLQHKYRHKKNGDSKIDTQKCVYPGCGRDFYTTKALQLHYKKMHSTDYDSLLCAHCGVEAKSKRGLYKLATNHSANCPALRKYKCKFCDKGFATPTHLVYHERTHTGERPHVCKYCGKSFSQSGTLNTHLTLHIGKPIACEFCDKTFSRKAFLKQHLITHTQERPYACNLCPRRYNYKSHLQAHMSSHSDARPYICDICDKSFAKTQHLRMHRLRHATEKPFKCPHCSLQTVSANWFRKHLECSHNATNVDIQKYKRHIDYKNLRLISLSNEKVITVEKESEDDDLDMLIAESCVNQNAND